MVNQKFTKMCICHMLIFLIMCFKIVLVKNKECRRLNDNKIKSVNWAFSPLHLLYLAKVESEIYKLMVEYRNSSNGISDILDTYTQDYDESTKPNESNIVNDNDDSMEQIRAISSHPLMSYRMIRRFAYYLEDMSWNTSTVFGKLLLDKIGEINNSFILPNKKDLNDVMENLLRIQSVYELPALDLMNGIIAGRKGQVGLNLVQAYEIGKYAISKQLYTEAFDWIQNIIIELKTNPNSGQVNIDQVMKSYEILVRKHNKLHDGIKYSNYYKYASLSRFTTKMNSVMNSSLETLRTFERKILHDYFAYPAFAFVETCNGVNVKSLAEKSDLYCYHEKSVHPVWTISPLKIQIHSWDPYVYQIYDVVGESAMNYLQYLAVPQLERAQVYSKSAKSRVTNQRTASYAFLREKSFKFLKDLKRKIGKMVGLQVENVRSDGKYVEASEFLQIAVYGFGGHYSAHIDALEDVTNEGYFNDRIATFMLYLNDVEHGGNTAFPYLRTTVQPIKGSALVWNNLLRNGAPDSRTIHGGCPVLLGDKWISNLWILHNPNFQKRRCSLNSQE